MMNEKAKYSKYVEIGKIKDFAKIVHKNINNDAVSMDISVVSNKYVITIYSKMPTEDMVITIKSPFEAVLDTSKMQTQLCDETESVQRLWYKFMYELYPEYKEDYLNFWFNKYKSNCGDDKEKLAMLKEYLTNQVDDLDYFYFSR